MVMKTIAQILMDPGFVILSSNDKKRYMTLSYEGDPVFRLYIPYKYIPADALLERSKQEPFGWLGDSLSQPLLEEEVACSAGEVGRS
jgi:hypothetical protein